MAELGQLCKIELDDETVYKIINVKPEKKNDIINEVQTIVENYYVDVEQVTNPTVQKSNIPIYNIHIIKE